MDWQQKFKAIRALNPFGVSLMMRDKGDWYVSHSAIERKEGGRLSGGLTSGTSPEDAINQFWNWAANPSNPEYYIVVHAYGENRKAVRWNGFMWEDVKEDKPCS